MTKYNHIKRISRALYNECIDNTDFVKALAMLIYIKENKKSSVFTKCSYKKISELTGLSIVVVKKRMNTLKNLNLYEYVDNDRNIKFKKIRAPKSNVRLDKIDMKSVASIELGLRALYIVEVQRRKEYVQSAVNLTDNVHNMKEYRKAKDVKNKVLRGTQKFTDNGISYDYLSKKMKISKKTVSDVIKYGVANKMFEKQRKFFIVKTFKTKNEVNLAYRYLKEQNYKLRIVGLSLGIILSNVYNLLS